MWREVSVDYSQKPTNSNEEIEGGLGDDVILVSRRTQNNTCVVRFGTMTRVGTESINGGCNSIQSSGGERYAPIGRTAKNPRVIHATWRAMSMGYVRWAASGAAGTTLTPSSPKVYPRSWAQ